ncbi:MAG: GNAT family N-acetyltransferase [Chloroflexi bacterium]|nr:GNAT family N-acetyltransferase [Chloroflexota bacterium]
MPSDSETSLYRLTPDRFSRLRPLFEADRLALWNISIGAAVDGTCPGWAWADDLDQPGAALLITSEGTYLAGRVDHPAFCSGLRRVVDDTLFREWEFRALWVGCVDRWLPHWDALFARPRTEIERQHYVCTAVRYDWRAALVPGYGVRRVDQSLLDTPGITIPDHLMGWMKGNWGSLENYMARGFGFCTLHDQRVVSWSVADAVSGDQCEIGIQTDPEYRQRGLAAITVAACVQYALTQGYAAVGWHCNADNEGSQRTALRVGFVKERDYVFHEARRE